MGSETGKCCGGRTGLALLGLGLGALAAAWLLPHLKDCLTTDDGTSRLL